MFRYYKYRLYPNTEQRVLMEKHFGCVRWMWNYGLNRRISHFQETGKTISRMDIQREIPALKQAEATAWLAEVNSQSLQQALVNLDLAFTMFWRKKTSFPKFKSKYGKQTFSSPQRGSVDFENGTISVPKIFKIKAKLHRRFDAGDIKTVSICKNACGFYFAYVLVESKDVPVTQDLDLKNLVGIDMGIRTFATLSTGEKIANPEFLKRSLKRIKRVQRKFKRRTKGGKNREKQRKVLARIHYKVSNQRKDFQEKLSSRIVHNNQVSGIGVEGLDFTALLKTKKVRSRLSDVGWMAFLDMLEYKARAAGKLFTRIGRFEPSSKMCSCGFVHTKLSADLIWTCPSCNQTHDRDLLAATNVKKFAIELLGRGTPESTPVESRISGSSKQEYSTEQCHNVNVPSALESSP